MKANKIRLHAAALMLLAPVAATLVAQPAAAQQRAAVAQPSITNMALNADAGLSPGSTLRAQVSGTPNARRATLTLGESGIVIPLAQGTAGSYTGSYVVRRADHIDPTQLMTARIQVGERTVSRQFNFPPGFQALAMGAAPVPAQAPVHAAAIERFVMRGGERIEPGREIRFRLVGAPGGDAWMDIPGVISGVDLAETRPGVYEGSYTVRRRDDPNAFRGAVATLRNGNQRLTAKLDNNWRESQQAPQQVARDERPPQIFELAPANGERVPDRGRTVVGARLGDEGTGIDPANVRMRLNGRDVTGDARVGPDEIRYRGDLGPGRYTVEVSARDQAGNTTTKTWGFEVVPERVGGGPAGGPPVVGGPAMGGPLPLQVTSHNNNAVVDAGGNVVLQGRTVPFANVRVQVESVANVAGMLGVTQPVADATVQADRNGYFSIGVAPRGLPIPGSRYEVHVTASTNNQSGEERLTLIPRG